MVHRLIVHTEDLCGAILLIVGGLAVCQARSILHAGRCAWSKGQRLPFVFKKDKKQSMDVVDLVTCTGKDLSIGDWSNNPMQNTHWISGWQAGV
jgi:hypothetical protein